MPLNTETTLNILVEIFSILSSVIALMIRVISVMQSIITVLLADTMVSIYAGAFGRSNIIIDERTTFTQRLGFVLWFVLYVAFLLVCVFVIAKVPTLANIVDWLVSKLHAQHWYALLLLGVPAIVPGIIMALIMKPMTDKHKKWTMYILLGIIAIEILTIQNFTFWGKLGGIWGVYIGLIIGKSIIEE